jgi:hypothetical protein
MLNWGKDATMRTLLITVVLALACWAMVSQQPVVVDRTIPDILPKMKSSDWQTRKDAFYELLTLASGQANNGKTICNMRPSRDIRQHQLSFLIITPT